MCLKINWSVNRPDLGLARELLASGYGLLFLPAAAPPPTMEPSDLNLVFKIAGTLTNLKIETVTFIWKLLGGGGGGGGCKCH